MYDQNFIFWLDCIAVEVSTLLPHDISISNFMGDNIGWFFDSWSLGLTVQDTAKYIVINFFQ